MYRREIVYLILHSPVSFRAIHSHRRKLWLKSTLKTVPSLTKTMCSSGLVALSVFPLGFLRLVFFV